MPFNFFQGTQVGLQLYSLHNHFSEDIPGTFKIVRDWGFKYVEGGTTSGLSLETQKKLLDKNGLKLISFASQSLKKGRHSESLVRKNDYNNCRIYRKK